ncbi:MAG: hypothetical protein WDO69_18240 [Pseudomonadota bacterium]
MTRTRGLLLVSLIGFAAACSQLATSVDPNANGGDQGHAGHNSHAGTGNGNGDGDAGDGTGASGGKASPHGGNSSGGNSGANGGGVLSLTKVEAHVVGRLGDAVRFTVTGSQPDSGAYSIAATFEDADGSPVKVFDAAWDGAASSADGRIPFDARVVETSFTATATTAPIENISKLATAKVSLIDGRDQASDEIEVKIVAQQQLALGDACDPTNVDDRCPAGQSCSGEPSVCTDGAAPSIVEVKYLHGPTILTRGTDPDDDLSILHVEFLNASNQPVVIDTDTMITSFDYSARNRPLAGVFFEQETPAATVETAVSRVRVTAIDSLGNQSMPTIANLSYVTRAGDGITCDPRGFIACIQDDVCGPGLSPTAGKCVKLKAARTTECAADAKLDPDDGITTAAGRIDGASLWDPPASCTNPENVDFPEASVSLHLGNPVSQLTVTTQRPETSVDTVVYLMPACASDTSTALGCNDDGVDGGYASSFTLKDVPAGDYTIVVEAGQLAGGPFGIAVSTQ